ncbi:MAG: cation-translocating P-type ATPase [Halanaerobiaceae bacterium]
MEDNLELYQKSAGEVMKKFESTRDRGLNSSEVEKRLSEYGYNELKETGKISPWDIFIDQFKNIIVILLLAATGLSLSIGEYLEAAAVLVVILINALFGFFTEYRAQKSVRALKDMVTTKAKVIRKGKLQEIDSKEVVPGDILVVEEGDRITADGRLLEADNLAVDEAALTGESKPVGKSSGPLKEKVPLAERKNMVYMGTAVTRGNGVVVVTGTAAETEMGRIGSMLEETVNERTPLEEKLDQLGRSLVGITLGVAAVVAVMGVVTGNPVVEMLKTGIALAIAAVPEGLPAVATITLAIGMKKMAGHNALVKSLPAVETLGSTTVICTDKTGTLTENQMTVKNIYLPGREIEVTGTGYNPGGKFREGDRVLEIQVEENLAAFLKAGTLCSNAVVNKKGKLWEVVGDPTEGGLVTVARKAGFDREEMETSGYRRLEEIPFDSDKKYMAVSYETPEEEMVYVKGAPEVMLDMCERIRIGEKEEELDEERYDHLLTKNNEMAREGLRVLAMAARKKENESLEEDIKSGLVFLGFAGILDPPRPDVKEAIGNAQSAGVRTIMITGDHKDTALAIGKEIGIEDESYEAVTGMEMDDYSPEQLAEKIAKNSVFARVSPKNKLDIIDGLNKNNEVTAMTGDGVNDAPALKKADIGVAMGQRGTAVAREAADMILLDDSFSTIVDAVRRGRVIFDNIKKFIHYLFSCNLSEIIFILVGIMLQVPTPLLALQILWLNLVTDVFPALVMAWEPPEGDVMKKPPRNPGEAILTGSFKLRIGVQALIITLGPLFTYLYALGSYGVAASRTIGFVTLALVQLFHVFNVRRRDGLGFDSTLLENKYLWGAVVLTFALQIFAVYTPFMQAVLDTVALTPGMWLPVVVGSILPVAVLQVIALIRRMLRD